MKDKQLVKLLPLREPIISFFNFFGSAISSEDILYAIVSLSIYIYTYILFSGERKHLDLHLDFQLWQGRLSSIFG